MFEIGALNMFNTKREYTEIVNIFLHILDVMKVISSDLIKFVEKKLKKDRGDHYTREDCEEDEEHTSSSANNRRTTFGDEQEAASGLYGYRLPNGHKFYLQGLQGEYGKTYVIHIFTKRGYMGEHDPFIMALFACLNKLYDEILENSIDEIGSLYSEEVYTRNVMKLVVLVIHLGFCK